jgi:protein involved in polysaccharide export with SLBB domain
MKRIWKLSKCGLFLCPLLAGLIFTGCASESNEPIFSDSPVVPSEAGGTAATMGTGMTGAYADRLHVGETVIVSLSGAPDQTSGTTTDQEQTIKEDGTIILPLIGAVQAAGKTPGQLQNDIQNLYVPKYYVRLTVTVKSQDRVFYVGGEVKTPGRQLYVGQTTVTKAIQSAGDFTDFANKRKVWLIRANGERIKVNCIDALEDPSQDPPVYPGDQIQVPRRIF